MAGCNAHLHATAVCQRRYALLIGDVRSGHLLHSCIQWSLCCWSHRRSCFVFTKVGRWHKRTLLLRFSNAKIVDATLPTSNAQPPEITMRLGRSRMWTQELRISKCDQHVWPCPPAHFEMPSRWALVEVKRRSVNHISLASQ
jgi:hypothetical protein